MKELIVVRELTGGGGEIAYVPVPCRGNIKSVRVVSDLQMDAGGKLTIAKNTTTVNLVTVPWVILRQALFLTACLMPQIKD